MQLLLKRLGLALASVVVALGLVEAGLRLAGFRYPPIDAPMVVWNREEDRAMRLGTALHRSEPNQLWAPAPGHAIPWGEGEVVNERGYRGPLLPLERAPGTLRVATLGDSSTFGHSVAYADSYSARLAAALEQRAGRPVEVLCGGVIGFTVRQGIERYRELVRPHRPDVVVAAFGAVNDHLNAIDERDDAMIPRDVTADTAWTELRLTLRRDLRLGHALGWLRDRRREGARAERDRHFLRELRDHRRAQNLGRVDWRGTRRVSLEEFDRFLAQLVAEVRADGAEPVLLSMPRRAAVEEASPVLLEYTRAIRAVAEREDAALVEGRELFDAQLAAGATVEELFADNYHPSARGHALLAEALAERIAALPPVAGADSADPARGEQE